MLVMDTIATMTDEFYKNRRLDLLQDNPQLCLGYCRDCRSIIEKKDTRKDPELSEEHETILHSGIGTNLSRPQQRQVRVVSISHGQR